MCLHPTQTSQHNSKGWECYLYPSGKLKNIRKYFSNKQTKKNNTKKTKKQSEILVYMPKIWLHLLALSQSFIQVFQIHFTSKSQNFTMAHKAAPKNFSLWLLSHNPKFRLKRFYRHCVLHSSRKEIRLRICQQFTTGIKLTLIFVLSRLCYLGKKKNNKPALLPLLVFPPLNS